MSKTVENPRPFQKSSAKKIKTKKNLYELHRNWVKTKQNNKNNWNRNWVKKICYTVPKIYHSKFSNTTIKQNGHDWLHLVRH